jgi:hypothetical protein
MDATAWAASHEMPAEEIGTVSGEPQVVVPVAEALPELGRGYVVTLSAANPVLPLLPQDPKRRSAVILAPDNAVYIASTKEAALGVAGTAAGTGAFYLPAGLAIPVPNKAAWYAAATTTASQSRISVLISLDSE